MKKLSFWILPLFLLLIAFTCDKIQTKEGTVSFAANYGVINCPTTVTIYVDSKKIGVLESSLDNLSTCGQIGSLTQDISFGQHTYKAEIRSLTGVGCTKDLTGTFQLNEENKCAKLFFDFYSFVF
jgi:hypothetical protein